MSPVAAIEDRLRNTFSRSLYVLETILYIAVGLLLSAAAVSAVIEAVTALWQGIATHALSDAVPYMLDQLLLVLMLVEILHTVRISLQSQTLLMEPFLIVGLIASIRRVLVITTQAAKIGESGETTPEKLAPFRNAMIELGVLCALILVFMISIYFLRRRSPEREQLTQPEGNL